ncbi:hypothetical protein [Wolbachia pipientis]|nr:hypothetical protein [Wolbachia pipientis]MDM8335757.1 hypothetical protein [Wolbachia pipientis]
MTEEYMGGWTLHYAAYWGKLEVVEFLIDREANFMLELRVVKG